jgi:hypothetical protein
MVSNDPITIRDYMQRHGCSFPEALKALEAWSADHVQQTA